MKLWYIPNHVEQALALLLDQYKDKPRIAGLVKAFINRCQELEDAAWHLWISRRIENATGDQLDQIGAIVGEPRSSRPDDVYKIYVNARIRINWSQGTSDDVIAVLRIVEPAAFRLVESYPAGFRVEYIDAPAVPVAVLADLMAQARAAGMGGVLLDSGVAEDETFLFVSGSEEGTTDSGVAGIGFAGEDEASGGYLSGIYGGTVPYSTSDGELL